MTGRLCVRCVRQQPSARTWGCPTAPSPTGCKGPLSPLATPSCEALWQYCVLLCVCRACAACVLMDATFAICPAAAYLASPPLPPFPRHEVYDGKTDVWSFGVLLSELLTGQIPYQHTFMTPVQVSQCKAGGAPCAWVWNRQAASACGRRTHGALTKGSFVINWQGVAAWKHNASSLAPAQCRERQHSGAHLVAALRLTARGSHLCAPRLASPHTAVAPHALCTALHCAAPPLPPCRLPWVWLMRSCSRRCPPTCRPIWWSLPRCAATLTLRCGRPLWTLRQSWRRWSSRWRCGWC